MQSLKQNRKILHKDIFACLFSIHNTISLSCHEQVCLSGLRFERYWWERYLSKRSPLKHTCSWHDELIVLRKTLAWDEKYLPYLGTFRLKFEKMLSFLKSEVSNFWIYKNPITKKQKQKKLIFETKNPLLENFWAVVLKSYCNIWNQRSRIF